MMVKKYNKHLVKMCIGILSVIVVLLSVGCTKNLNNKENDGNKVNIIEKDIVSNFEEIEQIDAEYEKWLAATMVVATSMEYPEFENIRIYTESSTSLGKKEESKGVYVLFDSNQKTIAVHSKALTGERSESGTKDISSEVLGFASFDLVDASKVKSDSMIEIELTELEELIKQSLLVSIYSR